MLCVRHVVLHRVEIVFILTFNLCSQNTKTLKKKYPILRKCNNLLVLSARCFPTQQNQETYYDLFASFLFFCFFFFFGSHNDVGPGLGFHINRVLLQTVVSCNPQTPDACCTLRFMVFRGCFPTQRQKTYFDLFFVVFFFFLCFFGIP